MQRLIEYSTVPMGFKVNSRLIPVLTDNGLSGISFREETVLEPYFLDYDALDGETPVRWLNRFNTDNWALFIARENGAVCGGATLVWHTPEVHMLFGRDDLAVLWDIRIRPEFRRQGIGTRLFSEAAKWAKAKECAQLGIETQNINVPACRFYASQGCKLGVISRYQYINNPQTADHVMLIWYLDLKAKH